MRTANKGGQIHNQNAKKEVKADAWIQLRVTPEAKEKYARQAKVEGKSLTQWALENLERIWQIKNS
ncbi:toxin-antitoxin system HicB family antitoxin [Salmonella enterica]|nr:toxin-antitoxin system HicB family antitoxin [Salmonella enterica]EFR2649715.1 toxin-antitoxin system HicB family antitoxin [Salmonella enterica]EFS1408064.1 toxin-antitoxin system HicB family antitoxin [Salmonella enterica]EHQ8162511.1 toxin-antitoxin system HicB family antitoxin [Salmonella enterica]EJZ9218164.1 toxin-antitoxin system HicB family antitoxin [Salmonella enterica]